MPKSPLSPTDLLLFNGSLLPPDPLKDMGSWWVRLGVDGPYNFSDSPEAKFPFPFLGFDFHGFWAKD